MSGRWGGAVGAGGTATVNPRAAARLRAGHPWVFRSDVSEEPGPPAGLVSLADERGHALGTALYSPVSEIRLRFLAPAGEDVDTAWWEAKLRAALARRGALAATAFRVAHAEGDGLPSLVVDRYGDWVVAQLLSAGLVAVRDEVVAAIRAVLAPAGLLFRNDARVREREQLPREVEPVFGEIPETIEVREAGIRYLVSPRTGQKTGAFLDQRESRERLGHFAAGLVAERPVRALDCFAYQGLFALHLGAAGAHEVVAVESSAEALRRLEENAALNALSGIRAVEANAFDWLRAETAGGSARYDVIVLDPPAFARDRRSLARALSGYKELNLRAMKLLAPGGFLFTTSCSHNVHRADFFRMLSDAAADSGRRLALVEIRGAGSDHPELLTVPETGYLKAALLRLME